MFHLGSYSRSLYGAVRGKSGLLGEAAVVGGSAFIVGYLASKSNLKGQGGRFLKVPIPALAALTLGAIGLSGYAGAASHHVLNAAKASLALYAGFAGVKAAAAPTGMPATISALPYPQYAGYMGAPRVGATPNVEQLFQSVGLAARR